MRIISGKYKGRRFSPPTNITARPTTDFAKESLFNLIANHTDFEGLVVLDLFAGTGSISFEFASRDALSVTAIEMSERQLGFIRKLTKELEFENQIHAYRQDVFRFLENNNNTYDLIFADPPYQLERIDELPNLIFSKKRLNPGGLFILEHGVKTSFESHPNFVSHRNYGNVHFSFFEEKE